MFSCFLEMAQVYLLLAGCRVYKGHLQNEWVIKTVREPLKGRKFVCIKSSIKSSTTMHNLYAFCRNSKISRNSSYRFLWNFAHRKTSNQSIRSVKHFQKNPIRAEIRFRAKTVLTSLSRDIYSDRPKHNCCGATVGSEQQHNQGKDMRGDEFSNSSLFTTMHCI